MEFNVEKYISPFIESQFPSFYKEEGPNFIQFVKAYYEWLEQDGQAVGEARRIFDYRDIDNTPSNTVEDFLSHFQQKYLYGIPYNIIADKRLLLKHIFDVYRSKGNVQCYKLLFRLVYNEDMDVYLPGYDLLKPSDGTWEEPRYLEVTDSELLQTFVGKKIMGLSSKTSAIVENFIREPINKNIISTLFLSNIQPKNAEFSIGEKLVIAGGPATSLSQAAQPTLYEIIFSTDYGDKEFVNKMYEITLGRGPDLNSFNYWMNQLAQGVARLQIVSLFFGSSEYSNLYSNNERFITSLYTNILNRPSDTEGYKYWINVLNNNLKTRFEISNDFLNSIEFNANIFQFKPAKTHEILLKSIYNDKEFVTKLYEILLGREPDSSGYTYWVNRIVQGTERTQVIKEFILSQEYTNDYPDNNSFITSLFSNLLSRAPDEKGYQYWLDVLKNNVLTKSEIVTEFLNSKEFKNNFLTFKSTGISLTEADILASPKVIGSLDTVEIYNGGQDFKVGDELKIVHRDIDSGNVISFGVDGTVKVSDVQRFYGSIGFKIDNGGYGYSINSLSFVYPYTNSSFTDTPTANASFKVGMITNAQKVEYNTDMIIDHYNQSINSVSYNFPANTSANSGTPIKDCLIFKTDYFGTVYSLTNILSGNNYTQPPYVNVCSVIKSGPLAGSVSYSNTSNTVTGTGTEFTKFFKPEDVLILRADIGFDFTEETIPIKEVVNNTVIELYGFPKYSSTSSSQYKLGYPVLKSQLTEYEAAGVNGVKQVSLSRANLRELLATNLSNEYFVYGLYRLFLNKAPDYTSSQYWISQLSKGVSKGTIISSFLSSGEYNTLYPTNEQFITSLFNNILGTTPDANSYSYYVGLLNDASAKKEFVAADFISSSQYDTEISHEKFVSGIYSLLDIRLDPAYVQRQDPVVIEQEIIDWTQKLVAKETTRTHVVSEIVRKYDYQTIISNEQYITALYNVILGREPDASGFAYWLGILNGNLLSKYNVANEFINSKEYLTTDNTTFVTYFYQRYLGRSPNTTELNYWVGKLTNYSITKSQFICAVLSSEEYILLSNTDYINGLYTTALGRSADTPGFNYWKNLLDNNLLSRGEILVNFYVSDEFTKKYTTNTSFVTALYNKILGRAPDTPGLNFWVGLLNQNSASRVDVVHGFINSKEYNNDTNTNFVTNLYNVILLRAPDTPGLNYWVGLLDDNKITKPDMISYFINSLEYNHSKNVSFVTYIYNTILKRQPNTTELNYWVGLLDAGSVTRGNAVSTLLSSSEYLAFINSNRFIDTVVERIYNEFVTTYEYANVPTVVTITTTSATPNNTIPINAASVITLAQAYSSSVNNTIFLRRTYEIIFGKEIDSTNYNNILAQLLAGSSRKYIIKNFFISQEYNKIYSDTTAFINSIYNKILQRVPGEESLIYWLNLLSNGSVTREYFITTILDSDEFNRLTAHLITDIKNDSIIGQVISTDVDVTVFIKRIYEIIFGRAPNSDNYNYWNDLLNNNSYTRPQVVNYFMTSEEYLNLYPDNNSFVISVFNKLLDRNPADADLAYWKNLLDINFLSKSDLINSFLNSDEFIGLSSGFKSIGISASTTNPTNYTQQAISNSTKTEYNSIISNKSINRDSIIADILNKKQMSTTDVFDVYEYWNAKFTGTPSFGNNIIKNVTIVNSGKGYIDNEDVLLYLTGAVANLHIASTGTGYANGDKLVFTGLEASTVANGYILTDSTGAISETFLTSPGSGYADVPKVSIYSNTGSGGSVVCDALSEFNTYTKVQGKIKKTGIGKGKGYWTSSRSFLNSDKYIQDSYYYQDFSYQINAPVTLNKYKEVLYNTFHTAGNELFSKFQKTSIEEQIGDINYETSPYYGLSDEKDRQLFDELNNLLEQENTLKISYEVTVLTNENRTMLIDESGHIIQQEVL